MIIETKFDVGDYAYCRWEKGWFLVKITDIVIVKRSYNVVGVECLDDPTIHYGCECCDITEHPKYDFPPCIPEPDLYTKEEKESENEIIKEESE